MNITSVSLYLKTNIVFKDYLIFSNCWKNEAIFFIRHQLYAVKIMKLLISFDL